ncbi:MAG: hypothetical protein EOP62_00065 [Sphingomonadales bacterium]|nr:MAG: hypothetical protein EOP62_00065 [Sphingomonadales bacterium]
MTMGKAWVAWVALLIFALHSPAIAHKLRAKGEAVNVADSKLTVTPSRDWNRLSEDVGKNTESWTLDGGQLNDLTFFGGIEPGRPLVRERNKKRAPLPKFQKTTLLAELPELLEGTYRTQKNIGAFQLISADPVKFLGETGVTFTYEYTDDDRITRKGEATAALVGGKLYMVTFDAPRLHYFDWAIGEVRALMATARL